VDNNYLDLGMNKSGFVHTLPSGRLRLEVEHEEERGLEEQCNNIPPMPTSWLRY
jgi:hypothetical protein